MCKIVKWEEIQDKFCHNLLLGNGASIAVDHSFDYKSLFEKAQFTESVKEIFDKFHTEDFERILWLLWQAKQVNKSLGILSTEVEKIDKAYKQVQSALIETIRDIHPCYDKIAPHLNPIYKFMKNFKTIISLNYDLIVYWATQKGNKEELGSWFKDGFVDGAFSENIDILYKPCKSNGATLLFYPHGNLIFARTGDGREKKIFTEENSNLLDSILNKWKKEDIIPIFVCEGAANHKKLSIDSVSYLGRVFHEFLPKPDEPLVIYGWSMHEHDQHILDKIMHRRSAQVAVSVYNGDQGYVKQIQEKLKDKVEKVIFFDASSPGFWNNASSV